MSQETQWDVAPVGDSDDGAPPAIDTRERRHYKRAAVLMKASLLCGERCLKGVVLNASINGVKIKLQEPLALDTPVTLVLAGSVHFGGKVTWRRGNIMGIHFTGNPRTAAELMAGILPDDCLDYAFA
jgi:hypothetical protein